MKRSWLITILFCLFLLGGGGAVLLLPQVVPFSQCSDVYKRYAKMDGVDATFIKDYKVNDTVFVDVTLLEAKDSAIWATLKKDFDIPNPSPDFQQRIDTGKNLIYTKIIPKATVLDTLQNSYTKNLLAISHLNRSLIVFHTKNKAEEHAVLFYNFDYSTKQ